MVTGLGDGRLGRHNAHRQSNRGEVQVTRLPLEHDPAILKGEWVRTWHSWPIAASPLQTGLLSQRWRRALLSFQ